MNDQAYITPPDNKVLISEEVVYDEELKYYVDCECGNGFWLYQVNYKKRCPNCKRRYMITATVYLWEVKDE